MQITKYFASLGIEVDKGSVKKVDKALDHVENRLKKLGTFASKPIVLNIGNFDVDQKKLNVALGNALDMASNRLVFEVTKFSVNQTALNQSVATAMMRASASHPFRITPTVLPPHHVPGTPRNRATEAAVTGAVAGGASRVRGMPSLLGPALALGLGGYGLSNLNQRNQEVVSAQLQTSAVVQQAGGTAQQGTASFEYLRNEGQRIGFNYLDASQDYNKLISGLTGSGIGLKESQKVFSGFAELARVNKLDKTTQNRLFRALSQVAGKGKLQSEELTGQIAEALPGGTALFAQAYQKQIGGNKTGSEAIQQLLADMKAGKVKSDILTYAGAAASQRANQGGALDLASTASQAEQARYQNTVNDLAVVASNAGVEEGFARIFRTLNAGLSESNGLVRTLSEGFNDATKWADDLLLWPQSFVRALEGKDSVVAKWLGEDKTKQLQQDWKDIKQIFTDISAIKFDFLPDLQATSKEVAAILNAIGDFQRWKEAQSKPAEIGGGLDPLGETKKFGDIEKIDPFGLGSYTSPAGIFEAAYQNTKINLNNARVKGRHVYEDPDSIFYGDAQAYDENQKAMAMDQANENNQPIVTQQFDISINIDPVTLANMDVEAQAEDLGNWFKAQLEQASVNFPTKE